MELVASEVFWYNVRPERCHVTFFFATCIYEIGGVRQTINNPGLPCHSSCRSYYDMGWMLELAS
jgi:hypothetical protein